MKTWKLLKLVPVKTYQPNQTTFISPTKFHIFKVQHVCFCPKSMLGDCTILERGTYHAKPTRLISQWNCFKASVEDTIMPNKLSYFLIQCRTNIIFWSSTKDHSYSPVGSCNRLHYFQIASPPGSQKQRQNSHCRCVSMSKLPAPCNLEPEETKALKQLQSDTAVAIVPADKSNCMFVLNKEDAQHVQRWGHMQEAPKWPNLCIRTTHKCYVPKAQTLWPPIWTPVYTTAFAVQQDAFPSSMANQIFTSQMSP